MMQIAFKIFLHTENGNRSSFTDARLREHPEMSPDGVTIFSRMDGIRQKQRGLLAVLRQPTKSLESPGLQRLRNRSQGDARNLLLVPHCNRSQWNRSSKRC